MSVSRAAMLPRGLRHALRSALQRVAAETRAHTPPPLLSAHSVYLPGAGGAHAFLALGVRDARHYLARLAAAVDRALLAVAQLPPYHAQRRWHVSIAAVRGGRVRCACAAVRAPANRTPCVSDERAVGVGNEDHTSVVGNEEHTSVVGNEEHALGVDNDGRTLEADSDVRTLVVSGDERLSGIGGNERAVVIDDSDECRSECGNKRRAADVGSGIVASESPGSADSIRAICGDKKRARASASSAASGSHDSPESASVSDQPSSDDEESSESDYCCAARHASHRGAQSHAPLAQIAYVHVDALEFVCGAECDVFALK